MSFTAEFWVPRMRTIGRSRLSGSPVSPPGRTGAQHLHWFRHRAREASRSLPPFFWAAPHLTRATEVLPRALKNSGQRCNSTKNLCFAISAQFVMSRISSECQADFFFFFLNLCLYLVHMKKPKQMEFGGWTVSRKSLIPINACPWLQSFFSRRAKEIKNKVGKKSMQSLVWGFSHPCPQGLWINPLKSANQSCLEVWRLPVANTRLQDLKPQS